MPPRSTLRDFAAALTAAGFRAEVLAAAKGAPATEVYRRPAQGRWFLEARHGGDRTRHVDVGLTVDAESLRCPRCNSWAVAREGEEGPFLACGHPRKTRKPFDPVVRRCRRDLVMAGLVLHRDPRSPW
jgi:hypothetical protein